ncbi:MAG: FlgD immunoglobulin-like domain containing protein, partial [bacterium]
IGSADNELFFPELPQIVGTQFELYMMVESEPAYCSYKSGDAKWEFVNKLESPVSLVASGNMGLVIRLDDKEIALGTTPVTIPAKRDFVIYRKEGAEVPKKFYISSPYPNPFNTETKIALGLPERVDVRFEVMNILGEKVKSVEYEKLEGDVILRWDGTDSYNKPVSSGLYLIRVVAGKEEKIAPTLLIK